MTDPPREDVYVGWSQAEIAADQALAALTSALSQADGLLDPKLDAIFARSRLTAGRRPRAIR